MEQEEKKTKQKERQIEHPALVPAHLSHKLVTVSVINQADMEHHKSKKRSSKMKGRKQADSWR